MIEKMREFENSENIPKSGKIRENSKNSESRQRIRSENREKCLGLITEAS